MDVTLPVDFFSLNWFAIIFKIVALILSLGYIIYAFIYLQQLSKMEKNALVYEHLLTNPDSVNQPGRSILFSLALLQLLVGFCLLIISLFLL